MNEEKIFQQVDFIRQRTLDEMEGLTEEQADKVKEGFNNTIRWNLGHIYTAQNVLISKFGGKNIEMPPRYLELFGPGSIPADWEGDIPTLSELKQRLEEQPKKLKEALTGQLDDKAKEPFQFLTTLGEILNFSLYHEGLHTGIIKSLKK